MCLYKHACIPHTIHTNVTIQKEGYQDGNSLHLIFLGCAVGHHPKGTLGRCKLLHWCSRPSQAAVVLPWFFDRVMPQTPPPLHSTCKAVVQQSSDCQNLTLPESFQLDCNTTCQAHTHESKCTTTKPNKAKPDTPPLSRPQAP